MNAIQIKERIDFYMDTTRNGRFPFSDYNKAVNDAIVKFINQRFGDIDRRNPYAFETIQQIRDDLFTLIKSTTPTTTNLPNTANKYYLIGVDHIDYPNDYYDLLSLASTISGISTYVRPTTNNELLPLLQDSFKHPTNDTPYYLEDATGYKIYKGTTGSATYDMEYIKTAATFSIGSENLLIGPGNNLTIGLDYIAVEQSVNNLVTYQPGQLFNAGAIQLVSGQVILASNTVTTDLPEKSHEIIAKMAADIMSGAIADYNRYQQVDTEVQKSE